MRVSRAGAIDGAALADRARASSSRCSFRRLRTYWRPSMHTAFARTPALRERFHPNQPPMKKEREYDPRDHARTDCHQVARKRSARIDNMRGTIPAARGSVVDERPNEECAEQHDGIQRAVGQQMPKRP